MSPVTTIHWLPARGVTPEPGRYHVLYTSGRLSVVTRVKYEERAFWENVVFYAPCDEVPKEWLEGPKLEVGQVRNGRVEIQLKSPGESPVLVDLTVFGSYGSFSDQEVASLVAEKLRGAKHE